MNFKKNPLECGDWSSSEIAELSRLQEVFPLPLYENENGVSEEGDPWWVITETSSDRVLVHITRIDRKYSVLSPEEQVLKSTLDPKSAIDLAIAVARARR